MTAERAYDLVLFGATGFTGGLTAEYLARTAPQGCRWALAGRNAAKLEAVRTRLAAINPACAELPLLHADVAEADSLRTVAESARVVISTVGPFLRYGEPVVAACAAAGTHYVDITGEPEFVDEMYLKHHATAERTGAKLVHACGFDSIPHDLGVLYTVARLPRQEPIRVDGYVRASGMFSGGTYASALTAFSRARAMARTAAARRRAEGKPSGHAVHTKVDPPSWAGPAHAWALPLPTIDPQIVARSAASRGDYGPDFTYSHHAAVRKLPIALGGMLGVGALAGLAQLPPTRNWLLGRLAPGTGPDAERRAKSWFTVRFVGREGDRQIITEVSGGDPGYDETAKMLAESALCLTFDENPDRAGQLTTAAAMGEALTMRLVGRGLRFAQLDSVPTTAPTRWTGA